MFTLELINEKSQVLELTHNAKYTVFDIQGLGSQKATVNFADSALMDGATFNSAKVDSLNIVIFVAIEAPVTENRILLYNYIKVKKQIKIHFKNSSRNVLAEGYVESAEVSLFDKKQVMQISVLCPGAYLPAALAVTKTFGYAGDSNPVNISNLGDVETGFELSAAVNGTVENLTFTDAAGGGFFRILGTLENGVLKIGTLSGNKYCIFIDDNAIEHNILNRVSLLSTWLTFRTGNNAITLSANSGLANVQGSFNFRPLYLGV